MRLRLFLAALFAAFGFGASVCESAIAQTTPANVPIIRFTSTPPLFGVVNQEYRYQARAVGRTESAAIRYSLTTAPRGMTIDSLSGLVRWTTTASSLVETRVAVRAAMATNASQNVTQTFLITFLSPSAAQASVRFTTTPPNAASVGALYTYQAFAYYGVDTRLAPAPSREAASNIRYTLVNPPQGMTIDATRGTVRWMPPASGTVRFSIVATSTTVANASSTQNVTVNVNEPRPVFISFPLADAFVGQPYFYNAIAILPGVSITQVTSGTNAGGVNILPVQQRVPMNYTLLTAPQGMSIEATSGIVRWTPATLPTTATVRVVIRASVVGGSTTQTVTQEYNLRVSQPTIAFRSQPAREARVGTAYTYQPVVGFANVVNFPPGLGGIVGNPLQPASPPFFRFSLDNAPQGMTIDATLGTIRWMPASNGVVTVSIRAALASNAQTATTQTYQINVAAPPITVSFTTMPGSVFIDLGREFTYNARAAASAATTASIRYSLGRAPEGARIDSLTGTVRWTPQQAGEFGIEIIAQLPNGTPRPAEARQAFTMYVRAVVCALVQGVVRATDGTVIAAGTVRALVTNVTGASVGGSPFFYTATIRNGIFTMPIGAGSYTLSFSGNDFNDVWFAGTSLNTTATVTSPERANRINVRCGDTLSYAAVVQRRPAARFFAVSGRVTQRSNNAPVTATIEVVGDADPLLINGGIIRRTTRTDAQGNYRITQLDNRYIYTFRALPDEPRPTAATTSALLLPQYYDNTLNLAEARRVRLSGDLTGINFALEARPTFSNSLSGSVRGSNGAAIAGQVIAFMTATTANTPQYASLDVRSETVSSAGTFTFRNLTPGEYVLQAFPNSERDFASGYYVAGTIATTRWREATRINVTATAAERVTITLPSRRPAIALAASVSGVVSNDAGPAAESVAGATIYLVNNTGEIVAEALTDKHGRFDAGMIEYGTYTLIADKPGFSMASTQVFAEYPAAIEKSLILQKPTNVLLTSLAEQMQSATQFAQILSIAPNPVSATAMIQLPFFQGAARLSVVNMRGEEVFTTLLNTPQPQFSFDAQSLPTGVYIVQVIGENLRAQARMLIAR
ncbi:MAG: carboxypeptidase regulatory-like domain-containing protein [Candidatus Kapabacteria bacterium]|nr:carboxypeptidase regulatory-like domain-containing protein [Candidatus Kapabacteria bacterium]